jgi:ADP-ribosylation factor GTPase-activating protein 1
MDAWSGDQLKKMQLGGNDALNSFLGKYGVDKDTEIPEKYNSQAAEVQPARLGSPAARGAEPVAPACRRCPCAGRSADTRRVRPQFYREKIKAEAEGRPYVAPPPSKVAPAPRASASAAGRAGAGSRQGGWDDWGDERGGGGAGAAPMKVRTPPRSAPRPAPRSAARA